MITKHGGYEAPGFDEWASRPENLTNIANERDELLVKAMGITKRTDFSTWEGFGLLWVWAQNQKWWEEFLKTIKTYLDRTLIPPNIINPPVFADMLCKFLGNSNCTEIFAILNFPILKSEKQITLEKQGCVFNGQERLDNHEINPEKECYCGRPNKKEKV